MKKYSVYLMSLLLAACQPNQSTTHPESIDTIRAEQADAITLPKSQQKGKGAELANVWEASVRPAKKGKPAKLVVNGKVGVADPKAKVQLVKKQGSSDAHGVLTLVLSHPPGKGGRETAVRYEVTLKANDQYTRVNIEYKNKPIATIGHIK